ncbi:GNAT family N-acetyltransferase [Streptomyces sp. DSM 42041]|uniref:GNAT family N-acetyltransferase n=1 Tax=Streptomyces hazeniae TaxID=3075538 RepID=A0ABU2NRS9_9ACTN|nr:GNAT family N-acetyltransferase [Streptomyces sp. DSM 42041]MDT0379450.1 GNAT family N-acetyltransferase [Streptomyces sp. DSM 42041]
MDSDLRNVLLGLISATVAAIIARLVELFRKHRLRVRTTKKHPIGGIYISTYTDAMDGVTRTIRDKVYINQIGATFSGYSQNLETGRRFDFDGQIVNEKYLAGTYRGEQREDEGLGVFYMALHLIKSGYIEGLWAGYGAESGSIISGQWKWRKMAQVHIRDCTPSDSILPDAVALLNDSLGSGYVSMAEAEELTLTPEGVVLVAENEHGQLRGVGTAHVMEDPAKEDLERRLHSAGIRRPNLMGTKVGLLKSAAVVPRGRGQGIGLQLINRRLSRLKELGCSTAVVLAWDSGGVHSSTGVLESAGFQRVADLPEYWREPVGEETFDCLSCGRPCVCTAVLLRRSLYDFDGEGDSRKKHFWSRTPT